MNVAQSLDRSILKPVSSLEASVQLTVSWLAHAPVASKVADIASHLIATSANERFEKKLPELNGVVDVVFITPNPTGVPWKAEITAFPISNREFTLEIWRTA
jgi:hypothetical protein